MESCLKGNSHTSESIMAKYADERPPEKPRYTGSTTALRPVMLFLAATAVATSVLVALPPQVKNFILSRQNTSESISKDLQSYPPTYAIFGKSRTEEHLVHVVNVLHKFGYERVQVNESWNLLWAHDYPFLSLPNLKNLGQHQIVNHIPGCGLPAQRDDFLAYAHAHPDVLFVEKHNEHRHIKVRKPSDIDLWSNDSFVQEFIQKPFLVDGHKFDIGVYVAITEMNPLRAYIYTGDVLFRYCPVKYYPFDSENVDKYIVGDDYLPTWEVPSLRKYSNHFGGSMRTVFEAYVRDQAMDPTKIWPQVEHIIRTTILAKEKDIVNILHSYRQHNFFDLMRFDLFIDENLKVYLMEANMSPNLSSAHFKPNSLLYEQVLYSVFNLVGIRQLHGTGAPMFSEISEVLASDKNLATALNSCSSNCDKNCNKEECSLCIPCLSGSQYKMLHQAYQEHLHRIDMKRIFPKPILNLQSFNIIEETSNMSKKNAWMTRWFYNKCQYERAWCV
ncbi:probable tubulin polyglutamylase ttll-15 isoform X2 [Drosophila obscura]|uniref:probable tubulin polyglutamylase ttll-15 isoform X2 n=1 Tax=Drosophila obscura TaxID=7282 RepID=UPI000B9FC01B|nr:probable tubulin polyglutamylase ttll-15 isoform X2 [Drosophila obscura]